MNRPLFIVCMGGMGDVVCVTPTLAALKRDDPARRLVVFYLAAHQRDVLLRNPAIDRLLPAHSAAWRLAWRVAFRLRWESTRSTDYWQYRPSRAVRLPAPHVVAEMFGTRLQGEEPRIFLSAQEREFGADFVRRAAGGRPVVAFHLDAKTSRNKNWPAAHWDQLIAASPDCTFIQLGLPGAHRPAGHTVAALGHSLRQSFAILASCQAFVGIDSGLAHAAAALSVPGVVLFGSTTPNVFGHRRNRNLSLRLPCSPCYDILIDVPCPLGHRCMVELTPESVRENLQAILPRVTVGASGVSHLGPS